ncbi:MAG: sigma-70 family RNA polymerase sigma factor [Planctomycetes bacterium]|nr:sigma-70 family RNA polymerase sigma factor [Planctomycetota bacterium]
MLFAPLRPLIDALDKTTTDTARATVREELASALTTRVRTMVRMRFATRMFVSSTMEDTVQECLLAVWKGLPLLESKEEAALAVWLSKIVRNKVADVFRRGPVPTAATTAFARRLSELTSPSRRAAKSETMARVLEHVHELNERQREVIELAFFDGLCTAEIGTVLDISRPAAAMSLRRALIDLQAKCTSLDDPR